MLVQNDVGPGFGFLVWEKIGHTCVLKRMIEWRENVSIKRGEEGVKLAKMCEGMDSNDTWRMQTGDYCEGERREARGVWIL